MCIRDRDGGDELAESPGEQRNRNSEHKESKDHHAHHKKPTPTGYLQWRSIVIWKVIAWDGPRKSVTARISLLHLTLYR